MSEMDNERVESLKRNGNSVRGVWESGIEEAQTGFRGKSGFPVDE